MSAVEQNGAVNLLQTRNLTQANCVPQRSMVPIIRIGFFGVPHVLAEALEKTLFPFIRQFSRPRYLRLAPVSRMHAERLNWRGVSPNQAQTRKLDFGMAITVFVLWQGHSCWRHRRKIGVNGLI